MISDTGSTMYFTSCKCVLFVRENSQIRHRKRNRERESQGEWENVRNRGSEHVPWLGRGRHSPCIRPGCWRRTWTWRLDLELSWRSPADTGSRARSRALRKTNANTNALLHTVTYKHYCTELEEWRLFLLQPKFGTYKGHLSFEKRGSDDMNEVTEVAQVLTPNYCYHGAMIKIPIK